MNTWSFRNPVDLHFGEGVLARAGALVAGRRYLLVTHPGETLRPWIDEVIAAAGTPVTIVDTVEPNPSLAMLRRICTDLEASSAVPGLVVALGGGSVMDTAKFLAAGHGSYEPVARYLESGKAPDAASLPILAIPTTAGTGSDLTKWATIWDPATGRKLSLNRNDLYAEAVLVDPRVTASLPWEVTLASGLDALSHALESLWNVNASPITRALAVCAAQDVMAGLVRLHADPADSAARRLTALGATRAGLAFSNTQTALAHNISYPVTLDHGIAHGIACSFCLPEVMTAAIGADRACDAALSTLFGDPVAAPQVLRAFLDGLGVPSHPADLGIAPQQWTAIVEAAFAGARGRNFIGTAERFPGLALPAVAGV